MGTLLAAALRCALGLGSGLVGRGGLGVVGSAVGLEPVFLQLNQSIDKPLVGGHPFHRGKRATRNPADIELAVVLLGLARLFSQRAVVALHGEMKIGVVVLNGIEIAQIGDFDLQLFHKLAAYGVLGDSPRMSLPPGNSQSPCMSP